ncbi:MAG: hypothetical protein ABUT11_01020 [Leifsonia sp.]
MTAIPGTAPAASVAAPAPRDRVGVVAFVLALVVIAAPTGVAVVTTITGAATGSTGGSTGDAAVWLFLGGVIVGGMALALLSPLAVAAVVLAVVSLFRRHGRNALGVWALVLGILPALIGPFLIPVTLRTLL